VGATACWLPPFEIAGYVPGFAHIVGTYILRCIYAVSKHICSQNRWICLSFWRKLLISFLSRGANSMFASTATQWGTETTFKNMQCMWTKNSQTPGDRFRVKFFAGRWHELNAVANALRISAEHNWFVFMFVFGAANDYLSLICKTKLQNWQVQQWRLTTAGVQSLCRHFHPESQGSSWVWKYLCVSQTWSRRTRYFWIFPWAWQATNAASQTSSC